MTTETYSAYPAVRSSHPSAVMYLPTDWFPRYVTVVIREEPWKIVKKTRVKAYGNGACVYVPKSYIGTELTVISDE